MTLPLLASVPAMSLAASIRRSSIMPAPADFVASEISRAASLSPSALMTAAFLSWYEKDPPLRKIQQHDTSHWMRDAQDNAQQPDMSSEPQAMILAMIVVLLAHLQHWNVC